MGVRVLLSGSLDEKEPANSNVAPGAAPLPLPPLAPGYGPPSPYFPYSYGPPPPRVWTVFVLFLIAFFAMQIVGGAVLVGIVALEHAQELESAEQFMELIQRALSDPDILLVFLLSLQATLLGGTLVAAWMSPVPFIKRLRLNPSRLHRAAYPLVALGAVSIGIFFEVIVHVLHVQESKELKFLSEALQHLTPWQLVAAVLVVGGAPAFGEEWFFRGYMQSRLSLRWGRWPAIAITSVLFGVMHLNLVQGAFATMLGVYIGYIADKSGSTRPGMVCHFANNALQVVLARYSTNWNVSGPIMAIVLGILAVALVGSIIYLVFGLRPAPPEPQPVAAAPPLPYPPPYFAPPPGMAWPPGGM